MGNDLAVHHWEEFFFLGEEFVHAPVPMTAFTCGIGCITRVFCFILHHAPLIENSFEAMSMPINYPI